MPNWSANRITLYEDYQLESDDFYNDKDGNYNIKEIYEQFLKDTVVAVEKDGEKRTIHNLMNIMPTPDILNKVHASNPPYLIRDRETGEFVKQDIVLSKSRLDEQRNCRVCHNHRDQWIQNLLDAMH